MTTHAETFPIGWTCRSERKYLRFHAIGVRSRRTRHAMLPKRVRKAVDAMTSKLDMQRLLAALLVVFVVFAVIILLNGA